MKIRISIIILLFLFSNLSYATDYYVNAVSGDNSTGDGTSSKPWKTITYALIQVNGTGHRINVASGTYNTTLGETFPLLMEDGVSLIGSGSGSCIIDAGDSYDLLRCIGITDMTTLLEGFSLKNGKTYGIYVGAGSALKIYNNIITSCTGSPFNLDGGAISIISSTPEIKFNTISSNSGSGISINNSSPVIKNNVITNNTGSGYAAGGVTITGSASSPVISNNRVINNNGDGIWCVNQSTPVITNNTVSDNTGSAIRIGAIIEDGAIPQIINNILAFNSAFGIYEQDASCDPGKAWYNLFFSNKEGLYIDEGTNEYYKAEDLNTNVAECKYNIYGDPLFMGRTGGDYHEKAGSPAIDMGDPSYDFSNEPAPNGNRINIGSYGNTAEAAMSVTPPSIPAVLYVDAVSGNDLTGNGTESTPWKTISYALNQVYEPGHTIHVAAGEYNPALGEKFPIYIKNGVSLTGSGIDVSIINAAQAGPALNCFGVSDETVVIEGFTIKNGNDGGVVICSGSKLTINSNLIISCDGSSYGFKGGGINIDDSSPVVMNNIIKGNNGGGVFIVNSSPTIRYNIITSNSIVGGYSAGGITISGVTSSPLISNNEIIKNTGEGVRCVNYSTPLIQNNTISDNSQDGIQTGGGVDDEGFPQVINNIISFNTEYGIHESTTLDDPVKVVYNLFYSNGLGLYRDEGTTDYFSVSSLNTTVTECKNNVSGDPLFINKTINNYHLSTGSAAINAGDPATPSDPDGSRTDIGAYYFIPPPDAPVSLAATNITQSGFTANWEASTGATGYYLDIATDAGFINFVSGFNNKNVLNVIEYSPSGLTPNTQYYYRIRAFNETGTSISGNVTSVATLQIPAPAAPAAINGSGIAQTTFNANWNASATAAGYYLDVATDNGFTGFVSGYNNKGVANVTTYTVTGLSANTTYFYRVRAFNAGGTSASSNVINVTTLQILAPVAPTATAATSVTQTGFNANWNASSSATGYYLDLATDINFTAFVTDYSGKDVGNVTTFAISGLSASTDYYYRIRAYNAGGTSSNSVVISATTLAYLPSDPVAGDATFIRQKSFTANWSSSPTAEGYYLDVATNNNFTGFVTGFNNKNVLDVLSCNISGLNSNTTYYYRVRAYNSGGTSGNSNIITVNTLQIPVSEHYVDVTTGNNSTGDGTASKPWKTITHALEQISGTGRHTINVSSGTYNPVVGETFPLIIPDSVSLVGAGKDVSIINANSTNYVIQGTGILDNQSRLEGFTISGGRSSGPGGIYLSAGSVLRIMNNLITSNYADGNASGGAIHIVNSSPVIEKNTITSNHGVDINKGATIYITGTTSAPVISNNTITGNANDLDGGGGVIGAGTIVVMSSSGTVIRNNIIINNNPGYYNEGGTVYMNSCSPSVKNNVIAKNTGNGICVFYSTSSPSIINNTISDNSYDGIYLYAGTPDSIFNNIISYNSSYGIREYSAGGDPSKVWYNLFYQNGSGLYFDEASTSITSVTTLDASVAECKNNLTGNPLFVDRTNDNYHLATGSPAIDAGDPASPLDPDGTRADIGAFCLLPPPAAPVATAATSITYSGFQANWDASALASGYYLDVATDEGFTVFAGSFNNKNVANVTTYSVTGLSPDKTYYFRVRAYNGDGTSASGNVITVTTEQVPAPVSPTANAATNIGQTDFTANWSSSSNATGYYLDIATDNAFTVFATGFNNKDVQNLNSYNVTGLAANTTYYYRVRAYNGGGTSPNSNSITLTTLLNPPSPPSAPVAISATNVTQTGFTANWNSVAGATGYKLDVSTSNLFTSFITGYNNKDLLNATSDNIGGLTANTTYYYRVRAVNSGGTSSNSGTITVTTIAIPPSAPVCLSASSVNQYSFTARWNSSATATGYHIDISTDNNFTSLLSGYNDKDVGNVTSTSVSGLSLNTVYYYRVRALNSGGSSDNSNTISVTTLLSPPAVPPAPVAIAASGLTQTGFTARWESQVSATGYRVDVSSNSTFSSYLSGYYNLDAGNVISISVTGLNSRTSYYYRVRAYNSTGASGNSNTIAVTTYPVPPAAPTGLTGSSCSGQVTLTWSASSASDFLCYRIYGGTTVNPTTKIDSTSSGVSSENSKTISGLVNGQTYYFRITAVISPGVASSYSSSCSVKVKKGVIPVIKSKWNDILICYNMGDSLATFQWYKGASAIPGATKQFYATNRQPGGYSVLATGKDGCANFSNIINISTANSLTVYPNPAKEIFTVNLKSEVSGRTVATLFNSSGKKVVEYQVQKTDRELIFDFPAGTLLDGIYTIQVLVDDEELSFSRVIIIN